MQGDCNFFDITPLILRCRFVATGFEPLGYCDSTAHVSKSSSDAVGLKRALIIASSIKAGFHDEGYRSDDRIDDRWRGGAGFVPHRLPPADPPLAPESFSSANQTAEVALARLSGVSGLVPSVFLDAVTSAAANAERSIIAVASLVNADRRRLLASPKAGPAGYRLFELLPVMPRFTVEQVRRKLETSFPTANAAVKLLQGLGIVEELTGLKTNRMYSYGAYVALLTE